jgi:hypothetical protein
MNEPTPISTIENNELIQKILYINKNISEYLYLLANEPSIGLYHVTEHVKRTIPKLIEIKNDFKKKKSTN